MHPGGLIQLMGFYASIVCWRIMLSDLPLVQSFAFEGLGDSKNTVLSRPLSPENMFSAVLQSSDACLLACCQLLTRDQPKSPHTASSVRLHSPVFKTTCPVNSYLTRLSGKEDLPKRRKKKKTSWEVVISNTTERFIHCQCSQMVTAAWVCLSVPRAPFNVTVVEFQWEV